jgi:hypothetical protein
MFQAMICKNTNVMRKYINPFRIIGDGCSVVAIGEIERRRSRSDEARSTNHH